MNTSRLSRSICPLRAVSQWILVFAAAACSSSGEAPDFDDAETLEGNLKRVVISDPGGGTSGYQFFVERADGHWVELVTFDVPEGAVNREVALQGETLADGRFGVAELDVVPATSDEYGEVEQALIAASPKKIALILLNFQNDTTQPIDLAGGKSFLFTGATSSNAYFKEISFGIRSLVGKTAPDGDVFGWYTIDVTNATCDYSAWGSAARSKAQAAGVDLTGYDHIVHYFPRASSCSFSGVAQLPGKYSWINGSGSQTTAHELGHNFGVHHASSYICTLNGQRVSVGGTCTLDEYGDPFDVMGRGYRHMSAYQKGRLGWFEAANTRTVSGSGDHTVQAVETKTDGIQSLRVPIPGTSEFYYVEVRQIFGFDSFKTTDPVSNGVLIHRATDYATRVRPALVDTVPTTTTFTDAALTAGKTFTDAAANLSITLLSRTPTSASVRVTLGGGGGGGSGGAPGAGGALGAGGSGTGGAGGSGGTGGTGGSGGTGGTGGSGGTGGTGGSAGAGGGGGTTCAASESTFGNHCYFLDGTARTQSSAASTCAARGSGWHLATIGSSAENQFVANLTGSTERWLGATDSAAEGTWVWTGGPSFWTGGLSGAPTAGSYANFIAGEPNNAGSGSGSDCLRMVSGGGWRDIECGGSYRAVCERD